MVPRWRYRHRNSFCIRFDPVVCCRCCCFRSSGCSRRSCGPTTRKFDFVLIRKKRLLHLKKSPGFHINMMRHITDSISVTVPAGSRNPSRKPRAINYDNLNLKSKMIPTMCSTSTKMAKLIPKIATQNQLHSWSQCPII